MMIQYLKLMSNKTLSSFRYNNDHKIFVLTNQRYLTLSPPILLRLCTLPCWSNPAF